MQEGGLMLGGRQVLLRAAQLVLEVGQLDADLGFLDSVLRFGLGLLLGGTDGLEEVLVGIGCCV